MSEKETIKAQAETITLLKEKVKKLEAQKALSIERKRKNQEESSDDKKKTKKDKKEKKKDASSDEAKKKKNAPRCSICKEPKKGVDHTPCAPWLAKKKKEKEEKKKEHEVKGTSSEPKKKDATSD